MVSDVESVLVDYAKSATGAETRMAVESERTVVSTPGEQRPVDIPFSVSRRQLYYWTTRWQEDERAAMIELARGEGHVFETAADAIRWLLDTEDD